MPLRKAVDKFPLRPFLPALVEQLSDADPGVREAARTACINLFSSATATAKSELKKEMEKKAVRKQTADAILAQVLSSTTLEVDRPVVAEAKANLSALQRGAEEMERKPIARSASRMGGQAETIDDGISPVYIASPGDLDRTFTAMMPSFEGKETEHNWLAREQSILKLRGMLRTGVQDQLYDGFLAGLKSIHEGILKATASLRTTLSIHGLHLVSELAQRMGEGLDSLAEPLIMFTIKMAGLTKKLAATASQVAVREILTHVSYRHKFLDLIWQNVQEKTVTTRAFMCGHLITILEVHGSHHRKHFIEAHGGLDIIERFLKKAVPDQNKDVREKAREALYLVEKIWPPLAAQIINSLDAATKKQVDSNRGKVTESNSVGANKASGNNTTKTPGTPAERRPGGTGPSSVILAAKRAAAARVAQERRNQEEADDSFQLQDEGEGDLFTPAKVRQLSAMPRAMRDEETGTQMNLSKLIMEKSKEQETPIKTSPVSFPPITTPKSPLRSTSTGVSNGHRQGSLSPSSIPTPVSPRKISKRLSTLDISNSGTLKRSPSSLSSPSSHLATIDNRPRTTSTSSTSSGRSIGRIGSTATSSATGRYDSFGQRVGQSSAGLGTPAPTRVRTTSTTSNSSSSLRDRPSGTSPSFRGGGLPRLASSSSLRQSSIGPANDETVQLDSLSDASMDLLASSNDLDLQDHSSFSPEKSLHQENGSGFSPKKRLSNLPSEQGTPISKTVNSPSSSTGKSRLPRPVSFQYYSPTPILPFASRHTNSLSTEADDLISPPLHFTDKPDRDKVGEAEQRKSTESSQAPSQLADSDQTKKYSSSSSAVKWFLGKASRLDHADVDNAGDAEQVDVQLSPVKKRPESEVYISQLLSGQADVKTFKGLARICKEFKLPESLQEGDFDGEEGVLQPGKRFAMPAIRSRREQEIAVTMWQQGNLFERLFSALSTYLGIESIPISKDLKMAALIVLHRLVENQFKLFEVLGKEQELIQLVYDLLKLNKNSNVKTASQAIMESWSEQTNVLVGISTLRGILTVYLGDNLVNAASNSTTTVTASSTNVDSSTSYLIPIHTLSLRSLSKLFQKLPKELIEEEVEKCKIILKSGLNHWNIETRQQAVAVLVAANSKVQDPKSIFIMLQPMERAQEDLLMYFMTKAEQV